MAKDMASWFSEKLSKISEVIHDSAEEAAESGENITKHHIETTGTAKSGKRGRVESGDMLRGVKSSVTDVSESSATASFGWLDGSPDYAWFQELGFVHHGGVDVEGMYALTDAREEVVQNLKEDLRRKLSGL